MFGLGFSEILIIGLIAFLIFGPKQFPIIARECIKFFNELKQSFSNIKTDLHDIETEMQKQVHQITESLNKELDPIKGKAEPPSTDQKITQTKKALPDSAASISKAGEHEVNKK